MVTGQAVAAISEAIRLERVPTLLRNRDPRRLYRTASFGVESPDHAGGGTARPLSPSVRPELTSSAENGG